MLTGNGKNGEQDSGIDQDRRIGRLSYIGFFLLLWIYFPSIYLGIESGLVFQIFDVIRSSSAENQLPWVVGAANPTNIGTFLPFQIPVFVYLTVRRLRDVEWNIYLSSVMWFPVISLILWFVPGKKNDNQHGPTPRAASLPMKLFVFTSPITVIFVIMLGLVNSIG